MESVRAAAWYVSLFFSFNGATGFRLWSHPATPYVKTCRTFASMEPQGLGCGVRHECGHDVMVEKSFNGATGFRLWSRVGQMRLTKKQRAASMEPQGLGCGVVHLLRSTTIAIAGFNGATGFRLWSQSLQAAHPCTHQRFNGATGFRLWSLSPLTTSPQRGVSLQWSHRV